MKHEIYLDRKKTQPAQFKVSYSWAELKGDKSYYIFGESKVKAYGETEVFAFDKSVVWAYGGSKVEAYDKSEVWAFDKSKVEIFDKSKIKDLRNHKKILETKNN